MNLGPLDDGHNILSRCVRAGGPTRITQTVAKINVCERCGYTVALHKQPIDIDILMRESLYKYRTRDDELPRPRPPKIGLG